MAYLHRKGTMHRDLKPALRREAWGPKGKGRKALLATYTSVMSAGFVPPADGGTHAYPGTTGMTDRQTGRPLRKNRRREQGAPHPRRPTPTQRGAPARHRPIAGAQKLDVRIRGEGRGGGGRTATASSSSRRGVHFLNVPHTPII
jgi:hypothetical protein